MGAHWSLICVWITLPPFIAASQQQRDSELAAGILWSVFVAVCCLLLVRLKQAGSAARAKLVSSSPLPWYVVALAVASAASALWASAASARESDASATAGLLGREAAALYALAAVATCPWVCDACPRGGTPTETALHTAFAALAALVSFLSHAVGHSSSSSSSDNITAAGVVPLSGTRLDNATGIVHGRVTGVEMARALYFSQFCLLAAVAVEPAVHAASVALAVRNARAAASRARERSSMLRGGAFDDGGADAAAAADCAAAVLASVMASGPLLPFVRRARRVVSRSALLLQVRALSTSIHSAPPHLSASRIVGSLLLLQL
jgi:hypothetical protein